MQQQLCCSGHTDRVVFVYVTPASQKPPLKWDAHFPKYTHALLYLVPCEKRILTKLENSLARFARSLVIIIKKRTVGSFGIGLFNLIFTSSIHKVGGPLHAVELEYEIASKTCECPYFHAFMTKL